MLPKNELNENGGDSGTGRVWAVTVRGTPLTMLIEK